MYVTYVLKCIYVLRTYVVLKSTIFWDIMPCSPLSVNRRFGGTYRLHIEGRKNKFSKKPPLWEPQILLYGAVYVYMHTCTTYIYI
jgi:hypothetical protein